MELPLKKRAVIYCRVSTKEQAEEGNSLISQEKICREYSLKNGYEIVHVYIEEGESAKTADRTKFIEMLRACMVKKNGINAIITYKIDRLSRNLYDYTHIKLKLKKHGVEIKSTTEFFEDTPAGRFMENTIASVGQFDNDVRTERCTDGMKEAVRQGRYVWIAPVGYSNGKVNEKPNIEPNELAPLVTEAFQEVAKNIQPIDQIRKQMAAKGLTLKNGACLARSYFYRMLKNELYCGWLSKFKERHRGTYQPLISQSLFDQVQLVINGRKRTNRFYKINNPDFPLRRFVKHPDGALLTASWCTGRSKQYPYYRFLKPNFQINKAIFESQYMSFVNSFRLDNEILCRLHIAMENKLISKLEKNIYRTKQITLQIDEKKKRQTFLLEQRFKGVIGDDLLKEHLDVISTEIYNLEMQLGALPGKKPEFSKLLTLSEHFLKDPAQVWLEASYDKKVRLQWFQFPKGLIYDSNGFSTKEIRNVFKVKTPYFDELSSIVNYRAQEKKSPELAHEIEIENKADAETVFWEKIGEELVELGLILSEKPPDIPNEVLDADP